MNIRATITVRLTLLDSDGLPTDGDDMAATGIRGVGADDFAAVEGNVRRLADMVAVKVVSALADLLAQRQTSQAPQASRPA